MAESTEKHYFEHNNLVPHEFLFPFTTEIKKGDSFTLVLVLQFYLESVGYLDKDEKYQWEYDEELENVVKKFQKDYGITIDGVVGIETISKLHYALEQKVGLAKSLLIRDYNTVQAECIKLDYDTESDMYVELHFMTEEYKFKGSDEDIHNYHPGFLVAWGAQSISYNVDAEACTEEATIKLILNPADKGKVDQIYVGQIARAVLRNVKGEHFYTILGYVASYKTELSNNEKWTTVQIKNFRNLETEIWDYNKTADAIEHLSKISELMNSNFDVNVDGFSNWAEQFTMVTESSTTDGSTSEDTTSTGTKTISECFDMAKPFIHPYHDGKYQTGSSTHDPETAWNAYQNGTRHFDCFGCSAFLFYVIKNFANKAVRVIHRHSASARSGTHYTVQLKNENGDWYDPKDEYNKLDRWLRVNSGAIQGIHQVYEG